MNSRYYTPSGKVPLRAHPIFALYCLATLPGAWIYAWATIHAPVIVSPVLTLLYGIWLGYLGQRAALRAKVRHPARMAGLGMSIGFGGWYFQWAAWIAMVATMEAGRPGVHFASFVGIVLHPGALYRTIVEVAQVGA